MQFFCTFEVKIFHTLKSAILASLEAKWTFSIISIILHLPSNVVNRSVSHVPDQGYFTVFLSNMAKKDSRQHGSNLKFSAT